MKKDVIISVLLLLLLQTNLWAQVDFGDYSIDVESDLVWCELTLTSDYSYQLSLDCYESEDMVYCAVLSYGHYSCEGNHLLFHDDFYNYELNLSIVNNRIILNHGFSFLNNKTIKAYYQQQSNIFSPDNEFLNRKINTIKSFLNKGDQPELLLGVYSDNRELYSLKIGKLNRYQLFFKDVLISQGVWKQRANLLLLCDKALGYVLSLALGKNEMIGIKIPGEFGGPFFTFSSTPQ